MNPVFPESELSDRLKSDELCGIFSDNRLCIIVRSQKRVDEIFRELKNIIISLNEPISITLGTHTFQAKHIENADNIYVLLGEAMNHTVYTYKNHNRGNHQLYKKLYDLRKDLESAPEKSRITDMMCKKASYQQKYSAKKL